MKTIYIAEDGTQFEDEYYCRKHEYDILMKQFQFYDEKRNPITEIKNIDNIKYVYVGTNESAKNAKKFLCDEFGTCGFGIDHPGLWYYDDDEDEFVEVGDRLKELEQTQKELKKIINDFEKIRKKV